MTVTNSIGLDAGRVAVDERLLESAFSDSWEVGESPCSSPAPLWGPEVGAQLVNVRITGRTGGNYSGTTVEAGPGGLICKRKLGYNSRGPGGDRGEILGFSAASRRRLREVITRLDWSAYPAMFVSLTYHESWGGSWEDWKADLAAFRRRLERKFGHRIKGCVWRLEFQERGAPHFHVVVFWNKEIRSGKWVLRSPRVGRWRQDYPGGSRWIGEGGFWRWVSQQWAEVVSGRMGEVIDEEHLRYGVHIAEVRSVAGGDVRKLTRYLAKYIGKREELDVVSRACSSGSLGTGRVWGRWWILPETSLGWARLPFASWSKLVDRLRVYGKGSAYLEGLEADRGAIVMGEGPELWGLALDLPTGWDELRREVLLIEEWKYV